MADQPELEELHDGLDRPVEVFLGSAVVPTHRPVFDFPVFIGGPKGGRGHERAVPRGPVDLVQVDVSAVHALDGLAAGPYAYLLVVPVCLLRARGMLVADAAGVDLGRDVHLGAIHGAVRCALREPVADPLLGQGAVVPRHWI